MHWLGCVADQREVRVPQYTAVLAHCAAQPSPQKVAATERYVGAKGHARQLGTTLRRTTCTQWRLTPHRSLSAGRNGRHDSIRQFPFTGLPSGVTNSLAGSPLRAPSGLGATAPSGGRWGAFDRARAESSAGLPAPSASHRATGSPRQQAAGLTATCSLGAAPGSVPSPPPATCWQSLNAC